MLRDSVSSTHLASAPPREVFDAIAAALDARVVGQFALKQRLLICLLCDGHVLVEGVPGLAKTTAVKTLAELIEADFHRIQFTPDLLPADITGTEVFRAETGTFEFRPGPLFRSLVLADEINRAPAKVQSALLEAMEERQVSVGRATFALPELFMVMATQNPIEQDGTYPLPEAQLDRFLLHVQVGYPAPDAEYAILQLAREEAGRAASGEGARGRATAAAIASAQQVLAARREVLAQHMAGALERYIVELVLATRNPGAYDSHLVPLIQLGASPRASIGLDRAARAHAWLAGRDYVSPEDIQAIAPDVLRHRVLLSYQARADGVGVNEIVERLLARLPVP
ncbi:MAG TPA: AAA family ATPase [Burkholderiales bacterium]|nr:AAA family ATPase [Burkholderiales bacterium]